jgi:hypothetical protein
MNILDPQNEFRQHVLNMMNKSFLWRGTFIDKCSFLEREIEYYTALSFSDTETKAQNMVEAVFAHLNFELKIRIFLNVLASNESEFMSKFLNVNADLDNIRSFRNTLAHDMLDTTPDGVTKFVNEGILRYMKFKGSLKFNPYSDSDFEGFINLIGKYMDGVRRLLDKKRGF